MHRSLNQFLNFATWNIIIPVGVPIFTIVSIVIAVNDKITFSTIFNRPDFLLLSATISGESFSELLTFETPESTGDKLLWTICYIGFPLATVISVGCYHLLCVFEELEKAMNYSWFIVGLLVFSVGFAILSWFIFNNQRNNHH